MGSGRKLQLMSVALATALSACSGKTFKQFDIAPDAKSVSVDATQRFLLVKTVPNGERTDVVVCAEPSPDAAMAVAAQIAASGVLPEGLQLGVSGSKSEALASLGLRTPAIQLVRDLWYRACEGYMNGVHGKEDLTAWADRVGGLIAVLAAFDAVADARTAPAVAIATGGSAESGTERSTKPGGDSTTKSSQIAGATNVSLDIQSEVQGTRAEGSAQAITDIYRMFLIASAKERERDASTTSN